MNDDDLKKLFKNVPEPEIGELARLQIRKQALTAFQEAQENISADSQVNSKTPRLTENSSVINQDEGNLTMTTIQSQKTFTNKPIWMTSIAASVALIGVFLVIDHSPLLEVSAPPNAQSPSMLHEIVQLTDKAVRVVVPNGPISGVLEERMASAQDMNRPSGLTATAKYSMREQSLQVTGPTTNRDHFEHVDDSTVQLVRAQPVSTFSIDVDTAAYGFVRKQLNRGVLPAEDAVRAEEMINYFDYHYPAPASREDAFATSVQVIDSPWHKGNNLVHIGIKGYEIDGQQPDSNLVFLLDVSGSMDSPDKLPLVKQSLGLLLEKLKPTDTVSIVVYAGAAGTVLEPTPAKDKGAILAALDRLQAGGSTAGGEGLALAYQLAEQNSNKQGVNRIILATDGDFNVGITQGEHLEDFVARKRDSGIYLSVLGFGEGNYQDTLMQTLAQNGNGIAAYIDTLSEAQKVFVNEATHNLFPIANDVKIQVEFNPAAVQEYRLIGYETRTLNQEDFSNDKVDAGDIGSGHTVTAIYEITPAGSTAGLLGESRYQQTATDTGASDHELGYLKLRYKRPGEKTSNLITTPIVSPVNQEMTTMQTQLLGDVNFSVAVAGFAQLLRGGKYVGDWSFDDVIELAQANKGDDAYGYRTEFIQLVRKAKIAKAM